MYVRLLGRDRSLVGGDLRRARPRATAGEVFLVDSEDREDRRHHAPRGAFRDTT
jgi:hypothetical protein